MPASTVRVAALLAAVACACSGEPSERPITIERSLQAFGIDTTATPRVDEDSDPLPADHAPLGVSRTVERIDELVAIGFRLGPAFLRDTSFTVFHQVDQGLPTLSTVPMSGNAASRPPTPWALSSGDAPEWVRTAAAGDVDGDGLEEIVVVAHSAGEGSWLRVIDDADADFPVGAAQAIDLGDPLAISLVLGDFDGDGRSDAAVAATDAAGARVLFFRSTPTGMVPDGAPIAIAAVAPAASVRVELAAGNLDMDPSQELAVVVNERYVSGGEERGTARWFVFDDAKAAYAERGRGAVQGTPPGGPARTAVLAGVAVGDLDGDGVDEIAFGGLTGLDPLGECRYAYVVTALDDLKRSLAPLGAHYVADPLGAVGGPNLCSAASPLRLRKVHVAAVDLPAGGALELQVNELTLALHPGATPPWTVELALPVETLFGARGPGAGDPVTLAGTFDETTSAVAVGDFTLDKLPDVAVISQAAGDAAKLRIWSLPATGPHAGSWHEELAVALDAADLSQPVRPILLAANVNRDSFALRYSAGTHRQVFTEPIVIAALAAPPCSAAFGQDTSACVTSFGRTTSTSTSLSETYTVTASAFGGFKVGTGVEVEAQLTVEGYLSASSNKAYTLTQQVTYTTGPLEDSVLFTTIPYDLYTYSILTHPNPAFVGREIVIVQPRTPIKVLTELAYFNENVPDGTPLIDGSVFAHTPGVTSSYRTASEKDAILAGHTSAEPGVPPVENGPVDVGQGSGTVTASVNVCAETGSETAWGVAASIEVKATGGVAFGGFSIGGGYDKVLGTSHGSESLYEGTVSNLPAASFAANRYAFGLFAYVHDDPRRPFEILDYWVEDR